MLTRLQFDAACKALITKYESTPVSVTTNALKGWSWNEHPTYPNFGYMSRTASLHRPIVASKYDSEDTMGEHPNEEEDPSVVVPTQELYEPLTCQQYVVFSATFRVPAFYFVICTSNGAQLPLSDVVKSSLFKAGTCEGVEVSSFALSLPTSSFPLLSHGDHPTLGIPCWYFHPCETTAVVEELLLEVKKADWDEETKLTRWMELWFMVLCSVVNL